MLSLVKLALRISTDAFDTELNMLIAAAVADLGVAGVLEDGEDIEVDTEDELLQMAITTYVKLHFGAPEDYDRLKRSYDEQKAQLQTCTNYTDWLET